MYFAPAIRQSLTVLFFLSFFLFWKNLMGNFKIMFIESLKAKRKQQYRRDICIQAREQGCEM